MIAVDINSFSNFLHQATSVDGVFESMTPRGAVQAACSTAAKELLEMFAEVQKSPDLVINFHPSALFLNVEMSAKGIVTRVNESSYFMASLYEMPDEPGEVVWAA